MAGGGDLSSLEKGLVILRELAGSEGGMTAGQLAQAAGLNRTTTYRLCDALERGGWVRRSSPGDTTEFELGVSALGLAVLIGDKYDTEARLRPVISELARAIGETVHVGVLAGAEVVHVARALPASGFSVAARVGTREAAHCAGLGKALLATLASEEFEELFPDERLRTQTINSLATRSALRQDLATVRSRGYALDEEEGTLGIKCVATPIFAAGAQPYFALSVTSVPARMTEDRLPDIVSAVRGAAALLTAAFGGTVPRDWGNGSPAAVAPDAQPATAADPGTATRAARRGRTPVSVPQPAAPAAD
ncbi:IclR family transcriptional regulator [Dactylosporangium salmoneum]|uniref:IclR family transcriptional regulator n=1 Tax=Dactylosporangium salmoneum TaxID=53361 RepID=A0ABP5U0Q9_9ACTN